MLLLFRGVISMDSAKIIFQARVAKFGKGRAVIVIPKAVLPQVLPLLGKSVIVTLSEN